MIKQRTLLWTLACLVSLAAVAAYYSGHMARESSPESGEAGSGQGVTDFTLTSLNGKDIRLMDVVKGNKVTLVNFFATWCPPCRAETPEFVRFRNTYKEKGVELISVDIKESRETVSEFASGYGMTNPILLDTTGKVADSYDVYSIPTTLVVDNRGSIVGTFTGSTTYGALEDTVNSILGKR